MAERSIPWWDDEAGRHACTVLERALPHANVSVMYQDLALAYVWARNIPESLSSSELFGRSDRDLFPTHVDRIVALKHEALRNGAATTTELQIDHPRHTQWYHLVMQADRDEGGEAIGLITTMVDVSDRKQREQTLSTLLREVSHRSKNLLAIILAIATQTGRYSKTIEIFVARFRGRIQSLANSQDLVTSSNWRGASIQDLVRQQTSKFCSDPARNLAFAGPNVNLNPNATLHVGLGIHELAVNSVTFGALSKPKGTIAVTTDLGTDGVTLRWSEQLPREAPAAIAEKRFGSVALERIVPAAINGTSRLHLGDGVLTFELLIPSNQFEL